MTSRLEDSVRPGLIVPPLTPFTADARVDFAALERGVDHVVEECAATMVIAAGVELQEYQCLETAERKELIRHTIDDVDGRRPVVVGISHASFRTSVDLAHHAESLGADAVQVLAPRPPFGGEARAGEVMMYMDAIARETSLPVMLYLNAGPGADLSIEATIELAQRDYVHFVKESSRDLARVARLIEEIDHAGSAKYYTTMQMLLISLQLGGSGGTVPPPAAKLAAAIIGAFVDGDLDEAIRVQRQLAVYPARWMPYGLAPVMKASMQILGVSAGTPYPPYPALPDAARESLRSYLLSTDLIPQEDH